MKKIKSSILLIISLLTTLFAQAQNPNATVEMADILHQNGKIYLVVLVLVTIFAGVLIMLIRIERKLNKLEKEKNTK